MNAYTETFEKAFAQAEVFTAPMVKANKLAVGSMQKLVDFQFTAMQKYVEMGMSNLQAVAEVDSPKALQTYLTDQLEKTNDLRQSVIEDVKALAELGTGVRDDVTNLAEANVSGPKTAANGKPKKTA